MRATAAHIRQPCRRQRMPRRQYRSTLEDKNRQKMYLEKFKLDGRLAVVTGGGQGIGLACAEALAEAGARVVIADRDPTWPRTGSASLKAKGYDAEIVIMDVTDSSAGLRSRRSTGRAIRQDRHPRQQCRHRAQRDAGRDRDRRALAERDRRQPQRHLLVLPRLRQAHAGGEVGRHRQYRLDVGLHRQQAAGAKSITTPRRRRCTI